MTDDTYTGRMFMPAEKYHRERHYYGYGAAVPMDMCWFCQREQAVCRSKITYDHPRDCHDVAMRINIAENWAKPVAGYQCRWCTKWHITSSETPSRRRRWRKQMRKAGLL